jgi:hypothetical protein
LVRETSPEHAARTVLDSGGEARNGKLLSGFPPNAAPAVSLELVEGGFVTPEDAPPLVYGPMAMLKGPRKTIGHVNFIEEGLLSGNARAEPSIM